MRKLGVYVLVLAAAAASCSRESDVRPETGPGYQAAAEVNQYTPTEQEAVQAFQAVLMAFGRTAVSAELGADIAHEQHVAMEYSEGPEEIVAVMAFTDYPSSTFSGDTEIILNGTVKESTQIESGRESVVMQVYCGSPAFRGTLFLDASFLDDSSGRPIVDRFEVNGIDFSDMAETMLSF